MKQCDRADGFSENALLHSAADHFHAAETLFKHCPRCFDSAGYLAHLGLELLLKTCILHKTDRFPKEHDLWRLIKRLRGLGLKVELELTDEMTIDKLNSYFELRYPNPKEPKEIGDEDWPPIKRLVESLCHQIPEPLQTEIRKLQIMFKSQRITKGGRVLVKKYTGRPLE